MKLSVVHQKDSGVQQPRLWSTLHVEKLTQVQCFVTPVGNGRSNMTGLLTGL